MEILYFVAGATAFIYFRLYKKEYRLGIIQQYRRGIPGIYYFSCCTAWHYVWIPAAFTVTVENFKAAAPYDPAPLSVGRTTNILRTVQNFTFLRDDFLYQPK